MSSPRRAGDVARPFGDDEEALLGRVVEADDLSRVEAREAGEEVGRGVDEADGDEGGRVRLERDREVLDELLRRGPAPAPSPGGARRRPARGT